MSATPLSTLKQTTVMVGPSTAVLDDDHVEGESEAHQG